MKTAIQELIKRWKTEMGSYIPNAFIYRAFIEEAESFLEKEKEQIINAFEEGMNNSVDYYNPSLEEHRLTESEQYYEETYNI